MIQPKMIDETDEHTFDSEYTLDDSSKKKSQDKVIS